MPGDGIGKVVMEEAIRVLMQQVLKPNMYMETLVGISGAVKGTPSPTEPSNY